MVTVEITPEATEQIEQLPTPIVIRMRKLVGRLQQWPNVSGLKRLRGELAGKHRGTSMVIPTTNPRRKRGTASADVQLARLRAENAI